MPNYTSTHTGAQLDQAIEKALTLTGDNQKIKSGTTTFGSNAEINLTASGQVVATPNATNNTITLTHATTHTATTAAAKKVGMDTCGHVVLGDSLTMSSTGDHTHTVTASGSITPALSVTTKYLTASASGAAVGSSGTATVIKSLTSTKLKTATLTPVGGTTSITPYTFSAVTASKATAGNAITYGNANRATSATTVVNSVGKSSKTCYTASYDSENLCLNLSSVTFDAVGTIGTKDIYEATASTSKLTPYSFTDVSASKATAGAALSVATAGSAITYATGATDASATGATVVSGVATGGTVSVLTGVTMTAQPTITLTAGTASSTGAITYIQAASGASTSVSVSGTAASAGSHKHTIE